MREKEEFLNAKGFKAKQWILSTEKLLVIFGLFFVCSLHVANARSTDGLSEKQRELLDEIKTLRPNAPEVKGLARNDVCYTEACIETSIEMIKAINFSVNPCHNFYEFACGTWITNNPIPPSQSRWGRFNLLRDQVNRVTQEILNDPTDDADAKPVNQVKTFYKGCIDSAQQETVGVEPLLALIESHNGWPALDGPSWDEADFDWVKLIGDIRRVDLQNILLQVYVDQDLKSAETIAIYLDQPALFLSRLMLVESDKFPAQMKAYEDFFTGVVMELARTASKPVVEAEVRAQAKAIIAFESELAGFTSPPEERRDYDRMYNEKFLAAYSTEHPTLELKKLYDTVFSTSGETIGANERIIVHEVNYVTEFEGLLARTDKKVLANYIMWRLIAGIVSLTNQQMRDINFEFTKVLTGASEPPSRGESCANQANDVFGMAVGVKYLQKSNFDQEAKDEMDRMVVKIRGAFHAILEETDWMQQETKTRAYSKAEKMRSFMAFPEWLNNKQDLENYFGGLEVTEGEYFNTYRQMSHWLGDKNLKTLREPTDREEWLTYPGVVNAFYSPTQNSITFPAGILQVPFFEKQRPKFVNYGGIGLVIGHEITHGFDNSGRQFDEIGNAQDWWDPETAEQYKAKAKCIIDQYSDFHFPEVDRNVNGVITQGENIADNGGIRQAWRAYKQYESENGAEGKLPGLEEYSTEQLFYVGFAQVWCEGATNAALESQLINGPHTPPRYRVIGPLRNSVQFAEAYSCPEGSYMNPTEAEFKKCILW